MFTAGDALIALASDGAHSNGFSLIRRLLAENNTLADTIVEGQPLRHWLLQPTRLYYRSIRTLRETVRVHALAHITGGGLAENLPRILPAGLTAPLKDDAVRLPAQFALLQKAGGIEDEQMRRIFNCGVGMVAVVSASESQRAIEVLTGAGETSWLMGYVH